MKSLKDLLDKKKTIGPLNLDDQTVFYVFRKVIKEEFGNVGIEKFQPDYFGNKILHIKSTSSAWASELWLNRNVIVKKMNEELGEGSVKMIKMK